jgi:hypothetical protein
MKYLKRMLGITSLPFAEVYEALKGNQSSAGVQGAYETIERQHPVANLNDEVVKVPEATTTADPQ